MGDLEIRLVVDPATGKRNIVVRYRSDPDALPVEHEEEHRRIVERLVGGEAGRVVIEREAPAGTPSAEREAAGGEERKEEARLE